MIFFVAVNLSAATLPFDFGISDEQLDAKEHLESFFLNDFLSADEDQGFLSEADQRLVRKVRLHMVELSAVQSEASGVILGFNRKNQPIILTAGHVLPYSARELVHRKNIFLDHPRGEMDASIIDQQAHVVLPLWSHQSSLTSRGWYGLPLFHPFYHVNEGLILREQKMDFGLYLMTGRTVNYDSRQYNTDQKYRVRNAILTGLSFPETPTISAAHLRKGRHGTRVLVMGVTSLHPLGDEQMSFVFSDVQSDARTQKISDDHALGLDTSIQYLILGDFEKSMSGAGVFNEAGELIGIVTKIVRDRSRKRVLGAIVLDIEHILKNISELSKQREVLRLVAEIQDRSQSHLPSQVQDWENRAVEPHASTCQDLF